MSEHSKTTVASRDDVTNDDFNKFLTAYHDSINVDDATREEYLKTYRRTVLPSEELGIDRMLKENYLLQYAMKNPRKYISQRNEKLIKLKDETDKVFITYFDKYTTGEDKLPQLQAKALAFKAAKEHMELGIVQLESVLPSTFEGNAYKKILIEQDAQQLLMDSGSVKVEK